MSPVFLECALRTLAETMYVSAQGTGQTAAGGLAANIDRNQPYVECCGPSMTCIGWRCFADGALDGDGANA